MKDQSDDEYARARVNIKNLNLPSISSDNDNLYHLGISLDSNSVKQFKDVKFVCMSDSGQRIRTYAQKFAKSTVNVSISDNLCKTDRFLIYKTSSVLWISHGLGGPSVSIVLVELFKLLHYARATGVTFFEMGVSCGLGVTPGTVVITSTAIDSELKPMYTQYIMGVRVQRPTNLDLSVRLALNALAKERKMDVATGKTFSADEFYEGEARQDGVFCEYSLHQKRDYLHELLVSGVRNIRMEAASFSAMCHRAGVRAAIISVTLVNRMNGDKIALNPNTQAEYEWRPYNLVNAYILPRMPKSPRGF